MATLLRHWAELCGGVHRGTGPLAHSGQQHGLPASRQSLMDTPLAHQPAPACGGAKKGEPWGSVVLPPQPVTPTQALQVPRPTLPWHPPALRSSHPCPRWPWRAPPCLTLHPESSLALGASPPIICAGAESPAGRGACGLESLRPGGTQEGQSRGNILSARLHPWGPQSHPRGWLGLYHLSRVAGVGGRQLGQR